MRALLAALVLMVSLPAFAQEAALTPEEVDARTDAISKTLRCVVCQNQTLNESSVPLAEDMKTLVRKRVEAGDTDAEVRAYMVDRYGDFVLMRPPIKPSTWALWSLPFILLAGAALWFVTRLRKPLTVAQTASFSDEERALIEQTLKDKDKP